MDALEKWIFAQFTPYQTTTQTKWMFSQKRLFKSSLLLNGLCGIQVRPTKHCDYTFIFVFFYGPKFKLFLF